MDFYFEMDSWKDVPMNKTFTIVDATSFDIALKKFYEREKFVPSLIIKEAGHARYWIPAKMDQWAPGELSAFQSGLRMATE
jgi:hypothetical protein